MAWVLYKLPTGEVIEVWPITDQNDVPDNMTAEVGRILVRNYPGRHPSTGEPVMQSFVIDDVHPSWEAIGELPPEFQANQPITPPPDPRQDLWNMGHDELMSLAARLRVTEPEHAKGEPAWKRRQWIHAVHDARIAAVANQSLGPPRLDMPVQVTTEPEKVEEMEVAIAEDPSVLVLAPDLNAEVAEDEDGAR